MKFVAVAIVLFSFIFQGSKVFAFDQEVIEFVNGVIEGCKTKMETSDEDFEKMMRGEFDKGGANKEVMCHINCMMEDFGTLKKGNSEIFEYFKSQMDEGEAKEQLETCQMETGEDDCETGYKVYMCLKANTDKIFKTK